MLETHDHERDPPYGGEMDVGKDVGEELAAKDVVYLVESDQDSEHRCQYEVDHGSRDITRQPTVTAQASEDPREIVDLKSRREHDQDRSRCHRDPTRNPEKWNTIPVYPISINRN